jgi:hypothetical protein
LTRDADPASAGARAATVASSIQASPGVRVAALPTALSFGERFWFGQSSAMGSSGESAQASLSFDDRFTGEGLSDMPRSVAALPRATIARAAPAAAPRATSRSTVAQAAPKRRPDSRIQLASVSDASLPLAYAPSDSVKGSAITGSTGRDLPASASDPLTDIDTSRTAIYDITARTVYLPNGRRLEAHSGLGDHMDDPRYAHMRMTGPTPPNVYNLRMRESLFHGVRAIRLVPTDSSKMHGRAGILAHSYMLGPSGQSNGCVSFDNYQAFLDAFERGEVSRLVVVERLADAPSPKSAADWFSNTLKDIFRRS